jgi:hypothetical protein
MGGRFTSGVLDLAHFQLGATLEGRMATLEEQRERLPPAWRAAVADVRLLLEDARGEVEAMGRMETIDPLRRAEEEAHLFGALLQRWGQAYYTALCDLHEMSRDFDDRAAVLGQSYATATIMPMLMACPFHRRTYEKPLGYAGDFRMMEYLYAEEPMGQDLFGRFLFTVAQNYVLARAVRGRELVVREALRRVVVDTPGAGPVRILAVAAGPAMELRRWVAELAHLSRPVELILLDQDLLAHETAHRELTRLLLERHHGMLPVSVRCLHFSVRQLVSPQTEEEEEVVNHLLRGVDFVYSTGLYDYLPEPVAVRLTQRLHSLLRPGGRLMLGNLAESSDSTWLMDYVLDWRIIYRGDTDMLRLAAGLSPARAEVACDRTGRCLFLDLTRRG